MANSYSLFKEKKDITTIKALDIEMMDIKKNDRLVNAFSNRSTKRSNIVNVLNWGLGSFHDVEVWSTGPLQEYSIKLELEFNVILSQALGIPIDAKQNNADVVKKEGQNLEKRTIDHILQYADILLERKQSLETIRDAHENPPKKTPIYKSNKNTESIPRYDEKERNEIGYYDPMRARQRIAKKDISILLSEEHETKIRALTSADQKVLRAYSCNFLTHEKNGQLKEDTIRFEKLLADLPAIKQELESVAESIGKKRLVGEYEKFIQKHPDTLENIFTKRINQPPADLTSSEQKIEWLIKQDFCGLTTLSINATQALMLQEIPLIMTACSKAKAYFEEYHGITYFAYPIARSVGKDLFTLVDDILAVVSKNQHHQYFKWVDTSEVFVWLAPGGIDQSPPSPVKSFSSK